MDNMHKKPKENKEQMFDKRKYDAAYKRDHYKRVVLDVSPSTYDIIADGANAQDLSKAKFITMCCKYCIERGINLKSYYIE